MTLQYSHKLIRLVAVTMSKPDNKLLVANHSHVGTLHHTSVVYAGTSNAGGATFTCVKGHTQYT
jgi:hypothetical protein